MRWTNKRHIISHCPLEPMSRGFQMRTCGVGLPAAHLDAGVLEELDAGAGHQRVRVRHSNDYLHTLVAGIDGVPRSLHIVCFVQRILTTHLLKQGLHQGTGGVLWVLNKSSQHSSTASGPVSLPHPRHAGLHQGDGAGRRPTVVRARLQRHIRRCPPRLLAYSSNSDRRLWRHADRRSSLERLLA